MTATAAPRAAKAVGVTAVLVGLGSGLGFVRDLTLGTTFGADAETDAFLVAWTIPETAAPLLIEGAMAFVLVPLFSRALEAGDDLRKLVSATMPALCLALAALSAVTAAAAPWLVGVLAPGIPRADLAVGCMRLTSMTILTFGLAGYLSAALRAQHTFAPPAAIYLAYNAGIVGCVWALSGQGAFGAAVGVAVGGVAMVAVQAPAFALRLGRSRRAPGDGPAGGVALSWGVFVPVAVFTLARQCQVFIERYVGSSLPAGSISHLNYGQKLSQVAMVVSLIAATVSFPRLARAIAAGDGATARRTLLADLVAAAAIVLLATAVLLVCARDVVTVLLRYGAFTEADAAATAGIMRVYVLGLLGQAVVGVVCRAYFCAARASWYPAVAMAAGLAVMAVLARPSWGVTGIAAANAAGITVTAVLLLVRLRTRIVALPLRGSAGPVGLLLLSATVAAAAGWAARAALAGLPQPVVLALTGAAITAVFCAVAVSTGALTTLTHPSGDTRWTRLRGGT
ncbi:murein biosynthesis integral membrane protein MurJ [Nonomuraea fuscirosea]|uniref:murein biosynthesis integral membrane protein MurJ n=1 Tax=Nonomuraea fuscirosea TaxID=1291556 RepID=UPI00344895AE